MKRILLLSIPLALLVACSTPKKGCKETGCSAGSVCNANSGACELVGGGGGGGGTGGGGGGATGGGGGGGGGNGLDAGVDAGPPVDPFDDGGVFVPGDICTYAIPVSFDGGVGADGGAASVVTIPVDLSTATNQYKAACNTSSGASNDLIFKLTLTEPKGLVVTATDTSVKSQDAVLSLITSPCTALATAACVDTTNTPEVLTLDRLPAGTWYVMLENYGSDTLDNGTYDVQFELTDPAPGPANDTCSMVQALTFTNGTTQVTGTTVGAFNDTAGVPLTCSSSSALQPEVFYSFTLTQPQNVTVLVTPPATSNLSPAVAITNTCGVGGAGHQRGCATGSGATFTARALPAGTYFVVVDGNGSDTGEFTLDVTLAPPSAVVANDTCASPTTLVPNVSQMVDANAAAGDYTYSCASPGGGDVTYQFTTTMPQRVTITATGTGGADGVLSLRAAPCDVDTNEVSCVDTVSNPEVLTVRNLPAGTYYVLLAAYSASAGQFGLTLALDPPPVPPTNDTCSAPQVVTLTAGTAMIHADLTDAAANYTPEMACSAPAPAATGGDVVYEVAVPANQTLTVVGTPVGTILDPVLFAREPVCTMTTDLACIDMSGSGAPETLVVAPAASPRTIFVVVKAYALTAPGELDLTFTVQ